MAKNGSISSSKGYYDNHCILSPGYTDYTIWKTEGEMKWWIKSTDTARGIITIEWSLKVKNIVNEPTRSSGGSYVRTYGFIFNGGKYRVQGNVYDIPSGNFETGGTFTISCDSAGNPRDTVTLDFWANYTQTISGYGYPLIGYDDCNLSTGAHTWAVDAIDRYVSINYTEDRGVTWKKVGKIRAINASGNRSGYPIIKYTNDGGNTWQTIY